MALIHLSRDLRPQEVWNKRTVNNASVHGTISACLNLSHEFFHNGWQDRRPFHKFQSSSRCLEFDAHNDLWDHDTTQEFLLPWEQYEESVRSQHIWFPLLAAVFLPLLQQKRENTKLEIWKSERKSSTIRTNDVCKKSTKISRTREIRRAGHCWWKSGSGLSVIVDHWFMLIWTSTINQSLGLRTVCVKLKCRWNDYRTI